jgi:hypothetical protein
MVHQNLFLATSAWGDRKDSNIWRRGMALDFFILDVPWSFKYGFIPTHYEEFAETYKTLLIYESRDVFPENLFWARFREAVERYAGDDFIDNQQRRITESHLRRMHEREPVHRRTYTDKYGGREMYFKNIGLITYHEPVPKKRLLKKLGVTNGKSIQKLLGSRNLDYYNGGFTKLLYNKGNRPIQQLD